MPTLRGLAVVGGSIAQTLTLWRQQAELLDEALAADTFRFDGSNLVPTPDRRPSVLRELSSPRGLACESVRVEITRAGSDRVPELTTLIGHAFSDDPIALWALAPAPTEERIRLWFLWIDELFAPLGMLWEAGVGLGATAWIPPGEDERIVEIDKAVRGQVAPLTDDGGARHATFLDWIWAHLPEEPHWYLDHIAVNSDRRGKGIGRALIEVGLSEAKAQRVPALLCTGRPERVPLFKHLGFRIEVDQDAPQGGPHIWFMRFDP